MKTHPNPPRMAPRLAWLLSARGTGNTSTTRDRGGNKYEGDLAPYALPEREPDAPGQLYDLTKDPGETTNLYFKEEEKRKELQALLKKLKQDGRSAPKGRVPMMTTGSPL